MQCFRSGLLAYGATGRVEVILNSLVDVPSVMGMLFGVTFIRVNAPSHPSEVFRCTQT